MENLNKIHKDNKHIERYTIVNNEQGITLVALVITIILLIILARISMSLITGDGGLFQKAKNAGDEYTAKSTEEKETIDGLMSELNYYDDEEEEIAQLLEIRIATPPTKLTYDILDVFDSTGMIVMAIYEDGSEKEITDYTISYNGVIDGTKKYVEVIYEEDGIQKKVQQDINITYDNFTFSINLDSLTDDGFRIIHFMDNDYYSEYIDYITYYVGTSANDTNATTNSDGVVSGLGDYTKRYVWAVVSFKDGQTKKSNNYIDVTTAHKHIASCYTTKTDTVLYPFTYTKKSKRSGKYSYKFFDSQHNDSFQVLADDAFRLSGKISSIDSGVLPLTYIGGGSYTPYEVTCSVCGLTFEAGIASFSKVNKYMRCTHPDSTKQVLTCEKPENNYKVSSVNF